MFLMGIQIG